MRRAVRMISQTWVRSQQMRQSKNLASSYITCRNVSQAHSVSTLESQHNGKKKDTGSSQKASFLKSAVGLGAGLVIGATIKTLYDENSVGKKFPKPALPSVRAANPLSPTDYFSDNTDDTGKISPPPVSHRKCYNFVADAVSKVQDGVVFISIKDKRRQRGFMAHQGTMSNGSGFIVSEDGLILTNAHVVSSLPAWSSVEVRLQNGESYTAVVEEVDTMTDLALLRISAKNLNPIKLGSSSDIRLGEFVAALGSPLSLKNSVTVGVVSAVDRGSSELGLRGKDMQYIQTDASITFGNSGGPLINLDGEVIGINSMTVTSGISFAIPIDDAKEFMNKAKRKRSEIAKYESSTPVRRYLGITMLTLTESIIQELQTRGQSAYSVPSGVKHGVFVWKVVVGSPAYLSGLKPGDIITHMNGSAVTTSRDVYKFLEARGDLNMEVVRAGQRYKVVVTPEE